MVCALAALPAVAAAVAPVRGFVQDPSGAPVAGARVRAGTAEAQVGPDGAFELVAPEGAVHLEVRAPGFDPLVLALPEGARDGLTLVLTPARGAELVVRGKRRAAGQTRHSLERETLRTVAGTAGDPLRALTLMPGFARPPAGVGLLVVRGAQPRQSAVFVDGMRVPNVFHFGIGPSVLAPDMIERIDYYPGNFPARYGQVTGGAIDVSLRPGDADHWQGTADVDLADAGAFAQGPLGESTTLALSTRRSYIDGVLRAGAEWLDIQDAANVLPVYWDYQARLDHRPKPGQRLTVLLLGSRDSVTYLDEPEGEDPEEITSSIHYDRLKANWEMRLGPDTSLLLSPALGWDRTTDTGYEVDGSSLSDGAASTPEQRQEYDLRAELRHPLGETWKALYGLQLWGRSPGAVLADRTRSRHIRNHDGSFDVTSSERTRDDVHIASPYFEATAAYPFGLTVTPALRLDAYDVRDASAFTVDPRLNARQALSESLTLKLGLGRFSQLSDWLPVRGGDVKLQPWRAWHYGLGAEWLPDDVTTVSTEVWATRRYAGGRTRFELGVEDGQAWARINTFRERARGVGWELLLKRNPTARVSGWISYSLSRVEQRTWQSGGWRLAEWDATHRLTTVWNTRLPSNWTVGVSGTLSSGYWNGIAGGVFDSTEGTYRPLVDPIDETDRRMPLFHQVDLRLEKTWVGPVLDVAGYVDLFNVGNAANVEAWDWDYRYLRARPIRGVPVFPALGVQLRLK